MRVRVIRQMFQLQFMIGKPRPDLLTLSTTFYDISVLCNRLSKARKTQIWLSGNAGVKLTRVQEDFGEKAGLCDHRHKSRTFTEEELLRELGQINKVKLRGR